MLRKYRMWIWMFVAGLALGTLVTGYILSQEIFLACAKENRVKLMGGGIIECRISTKE